MKRLLLSTLLLATLCGSMMASVSNGQAYRLALAKDDGKSAFVKNSSFGNAAIVVIWTETNVPSQQWYALVNADGTVSFRNVYTGKWLAVSGQLRDGASICQTSTAGTTAKWTLTPTGEADQYRLTQNGTDATYCLQSTSTTDGDKLTLCQQTDGTDASTVTWKLAVTRPVTELDDEARLRLMNGWLDKFLQDRGNNQQQIGTQDGWQLAEMLEIVLDAYETTANERYATLFDRLFNFVNTHLGSNYCQLIYTNAFHWYGHEFNDDVMWLILATIRGYLLTGKTTYLTYARDNFETVWKRGYNKGGWGMMQWKNVEENANGTNSCIDGPAAVAACYLGIATQQEQYFARARGIYDQQRRYLANIKTGHVFDSFTWDTSTLQISKVNKWASTYNQGTMMGAAVMLYDHYHDPMYKRDATAIMDYTISDLCDANGIVKVCQTQDSDYPSFKGILMRYVRKFIMHTQQEKYVEWISKNALHAYANMNSHNIASTAWLTKSAEDFSFGNQSFNNAPHSCATAVSAAYNTPRHAVIRSACDTIQAEDIDTHRGLYAVSGTAGDNRGELTNVKTGYYAVYENIDFGNRPATSVTLRVSQGAAPNYAVLVTLDSLNGPAIARVSVPTTGGWQTVKANISPVEGLHNVYLRFIATNTPSNAYRVDWFRFTTDSDPLSPDVTDNGGELSASTSADALAALTDNHPTTPATVSRTTAAFTYKSTAGVLLKGYTVTSSSLSDRDADPQTWTLEGSADGSTWATLDEQAGQTFDTPCQTRRYAVTTDKKYTLFRLNITANHGAPSLSLGEWQLMGAWLPADDITADGGSLTTGDRAAIDKDAGTVVTSAGEPALTLVYKAKASYTPTAYSLTTATGTPAASPAAWTLYGSKDNRTWTVLDTQTGQGSPFEGVTLRYPVSATAAYNYFKLEITANGGADVTRLAELQLFGPTAATATLYNDLTKNMGTLSTNGGISDSALGALTDNRQDTDVRLPFTGGEVWIEYQSTVPARLKSYTVTAGSNAQENPKTWTLEGSNDGTSWTALNTTTATLSTRSASRTATVRATQTYSRYRLRITAAAGTAATAVNIGEWQLNGLAIAGTSLTDRDGTPSAEFSYTTNEAENYLKAFDHSEATKYCFNYYATAWLQYAADAPFRANLYSLTSANDNPKRDPYRWQLQASNDGLHWDVLDERQDQTFADRQVTQFYTCQQQGDYKYYRLQVLENNGDDLAQISEWQLFYSDKQATDITAPGREEGAGVSVYPNPVTDALHVSVGTPALVSIYNMRGQTVAQSRVGAGVTRLPFASYARGMYLVKVKAGGQATTVKVLK